MKIGEKIRAARKKKGLTQSQLGKLLNVSPQVISNWERGYTPSISNEYIALLATGLDIKYEYLIDNNGTKYEFEAGKVGQATIAPVGTYGPQIDEMLKDLGEKTAEMVRQGLITEDAAAETIRDITEICLKLFKKAP